MNYLFAFVCLSLVSCVYSSSYPAITELGYIKVHAPGFLTLTALKSNAPQSLLISSFGADPLYTFGVYQVPNIGAQLHNLSTVTPSLLIKSPWPNVVTPAPSIFGEPVLVVPSGFLVPGKSTGAISLLPNPGTGSLFEISVDASGYFYHNVTWVDMNGDGLLDILTARATKPIIGTAQGNLLWYEQPKTNPLSTQWTPHQLVSGPDFFIQLYDFDGDGNEEILAAEFFAARLVLYSKPAGVSWATGPITTTVIDTSIGALFGVIVTDVNGDGKVDVLVTNHVNNATLSGVYAYEIPTVLTTPWTRHNLATGFKTIATSTGSASPGNAITFYPQTGVKEKPLIAVAGDGAQAAYVLVPKTQTSTDWTYTVQTIYTGTSTVGEVIAMDVNMDGYSELFVPLYDSNEILVFTYASS